MRAWIRCPGLMRLIADGLRENTPSRRALSITPAWTRGPGLRRARTASDETLGRRGWSLAMVPPRFPSCLSSIPAAKSALRVGPTPASAVVGARCYGPVYTTFDSRPTSCLPSLNRSVTRSVPNTVRFGSGSRIEAVMLRSFGSNGLCLKPSESRADTTCSGVEPTGVAASSDF
jgi:hypothetical protein